MNKTKGALFLGIFIFSIWVSVAKPSTELFSTLTTQILEKQTRTKSAKEILDQLYDIFSTCANTHKNSIIQKNCTSFLKSNFPFIQTKWEKVGTGGIIVTPIGKLSDEERLTAFGVADIIKNPLHFPLYATQDYEYSIVNIPELSLSFLVPHILREKTIPVPEAGRDFLHTSLCEQRRNKYERSKETIHNAPPRDREFVYNELNEILDSTVCYGEIMLSLDSDQHRDFYRNISSLTTRKWNETILQISSEKIPKGKSFKEVIQDKQLKTIPTDLYFDQEGKIYYQSNPKYLEETVENTISLWYTWDVSNFIRQPLAGGKNLQEMIKKGDVKIIADNHDIYVRRNTTPDTYYTIWMYVDLPLYFGYYIGFDINNPDGSSSFFSNLNK